MSGVVKVTAALSPPIKLFRELRNGRGASYAQFEPRGPETFAVEAVDVPWHVIESWSVGDGEVVVSPWQRFYAGSALSTCPCGCEEQGAWSLGVLVDLDDEPTVPIVGKFGDVWRCVVIHTWIGGIPCASRRGYGEPGRSRIAYARERALSMPRSNPSNVIFKGTASIRHIGYRDRHLASADLAPPKASFGAGWEKTQPPGMGDDPRMALTNRVRDHGLRLAVGACALLTCRNVTTDICRFESPSKSNKRNAARLGADPTIIWRDVVVRGHAARGEREATDAAPVRVHLVRGHFKYYDAEHALFGKHVGRWWWAGHARGDATYGIVEHRSYVAGKDVREL